MTEIVDLHDADHAHVLELCNELNSEAGGDEFNGALRFVVCYEPDGQFIRADLDHGRYRIDQLKIQRHQTMLPPVVPRDSTRIDDGRGQHERSRT